MDMKDGPAAQGKYQHLGKSKKKNAPLAESAAPLRGGCPLVAGKPRKGGDQTKANVAREMSAY
jgi:hypothetical protein